mmetsp:Transcript_3986/g.9550  ORF Transcript_3986/g.9550 Transcript_3986/m.9550 type:complete len:367 (+) Transcript_3986:527-1627(+)
MRCRTAFISSVRSVERAVSSDAAPTSSSSILDWRVWISLSTDAIFLCGHREMPWRRQIFLMADVHIPRISPASLIDTPKYRVSSSYQRGLVHARNSACISAGMLTSRHWQVVSVAMRASTPVSFTNRFRYDRATVWPASKFHTRYGGFPYLSVTSTTQRPMTITRHKARSSASVDLCSTEPGSMRARRMFLQSMKRCPSAMCLKNSRRRVSFMMSSTSSFVLAAGWFCSASSHRSQDRDLARTEREVDMVGLSRPVASGIMNAGFSVASAICKRSCETDAITRPADSSSRRTSRVKNMATKNRLDPTTWMGMATQPWRPHWRASSARRKMVDGRLATSPCHACAFCFQTRPGMPICSGKANSLEAL